MRTVDPARDRGRDRVTFCDARLPATRRSIVFPGPTPRRSHRRDPQDERPLTRRCPRQFAHNINVSRPRQFSVNYALHGRPRSRGDRNQSRCAAPPNSRCWSVCSRVIDRRAIGSAAWSEPGRLASSISSLRVVDTGRRSPSGVLPGPFAAYTLSISSRMVARADSGGPRCFRHRRAPPGWRPSGFPILSTA